MSTSETDHFDIGPCPCGKGKVVKTVVTQDNPWSGADISYSLSCQVCAKDWDLSSDGRSITNRNSLVPARKAKAETDSAYSALHGYLVALAKTWIAGLGFKTKKAEHDHLRQCGAFCGSYRDYLGSRKTKEPHETVFVNEDSPLATELVNTFGSTGTFATLRAALKKAEVDQQLAEKKIVRRKVKT